MKPVQVISAPYTEVVFVCRKCARKAGDKRFGKRLRKHLEIAGARDPQVIETSCFDLCPKNRIVVCSGQVLAHDRMLIVTPEASAEAAVRLLAMRDLQDKTESPLEEGR